MATTYVNISREEFEDWLDSLHMGIWKRDPKYQGIYLIALSPHVAVSIRSTVYTERGGGGDKAMGRGQASGSMKLVSTVTGQTLNKKAMGQSHFARTTNWRSNWKKGLDRLVEAYHKSKEFYEAIAKIDDRQKYRAEILEAIEKIPNWEDHGTLSDFHGRVRNNGILTDKQQKELDAALVKAKTAPAKATPSSGGAGAGGRSQDEKVQILRDLWKAANRKGDTWTMDFAKSLGEQLKSGRRLTQRQQDVLFDKLDRYGIATE